MAHITLHIVSHEKRSLIMLLSNSCNVPIREQINIRGQKHQVMGGNYNLKLINANWSKDTMKMPINTPRLIHVSSPPKLQEGILLKQL